MQLTPITPDISLYPEKLQPFLRNAKLYDSSCSPDAKVIFIDKDGGLFLKSAAKGTLEREAVMTRYFHSKRLSANVIEYISEEADWLLTEKIQGDDLTTEKYLANPERLCDILAETLVTLHNLDFSDCPIQNHTELYLSKAELNRSTGNYDKSHFPDSFGFKNEGEAQAVIEKYGTSLQSDTLLHGDFCLPNIIYNDWRFSGFIDLGNGGVGDRHVDIFWGIWSLQFNLKTNKYRQRFIDAYGAYGHNKVDAALLNVVSAVEVFG